MLIMIAMVTWTNSHDDTDNHSAIHMFYYHAVLLPMIYHYQKISPVCKSSMPVNYFLNISGA